MNHINFVFDSILPVSARSRRNSQVNSFQIESSEKGDIPLESQELEECAKKSKVEKIHNKLSDAIMFHSAKLYEQKCFTEMIKSVKFDATQKNKISFKKTRHPSLSLDKKDKYVQSESSLILRKIQKRTSKGGFERQNKKEEDYEKENSTIDSSSGTENYFNFNNLKTSKERKMSRFNPEDKNRKLIVTEKKEINGFDEEEGKYSSDDETLSFNEREKNYEEIEKRVYQYLDHLTITYYIVNKRDEYNEKMRNRIALENKAYAPSPIILRRKAKGLTIPHLDGLRILSHCQSIDSGEASFNSTKN